jgi:hypothetical protein
VTLDRRRRRAARPGWHRFALRVSAAEARRLRGAGRASLRVAVAARSDDGVSRVTTRQIRLR